MIYIIRRFKMRKEILADLLRAEKIEPSFEYTIEINGETYKAGIRNVKSCKRIGRLKGNLFLDKIVTEPVKVAVGSNVTETSPTRTEEQDRRESVLDFKIKFDKGYTILDETQTGKHPEPLEQAQRAFWSRYRHEINGEQFEAIYGPVFEHYKKI